MKRAIDQALRELKADRRKLGAIVLLVGVGLLLWGRLMLKNVPQTATATPALASLRSSGAASPAAEMDLAGTQRPVVYMDLPATLPRDLFVPDELLSRTAKLGDGGKSGPLYADSGNRAATSASAGRMRLQSVMLGDKPRAVINGRLLAPGEEIEGWTLLQLEQRHVLLQSSGITIRLRM